MVEDIFQIFQKSRIRVLTNITLMISHLLVEWSYPLDMGNRSPGKLSHARWLTKSNKILRLYISTNKPTSEIVSTNKPTNDMKQFALFVFNIHICFEIERHPSCKNGVRHFWKLVFYCKYLPRELKNIVDLDILHNIFSHT